MGTTGKRAGSRRAPRQPPSLRRSLRPALLGLALGVTLAVVAWGYLVYAAIDFGSAARSGDDQAWWFLGLASVGAVACLFVGLMLIARLLRELGITGSPAPRRQPVPQRSEQPEQPTTVAVPQAPGGRRASR